MQLVNETTLNSGLTSIANAIRTKGGTVAQLSFPTGFVNAVNAISGGGSLDPNVIPLLSGIRVALNYYTMDTTYSDTVPVASSSWSTLSQTLQTVKLAFIGVATFNTDNFIDNNITPYLCGSNGITQLSTGINVGAHLVLWDSANYSDRVFLADATSTESGRRRDAIADYFTALNYELNQ